MTAYRGLTWDHPRGRNALEAGSLEFNAAGGDTLVWDVHPLEGFESTPIEQLAREYDLIVLDHPHVGDALLHDSLVPLDELFDAAQIAQWTAASVGPSFESYVVDGRAWALPLDAATQVSARRPDLVREAPSTWAEVLHLAATGVVAPSLAGPHAFLSICSIAVSHGADPGSSDDFLDAETWDAAFTILGDLASRAPQGTADLNPIGLLELMTSSDRVGYIPLVYGYVNYSGPVQFGAPPAVEGRLGSTIGGTGIAVTRRTTPGPELLEHISWLMSPDAQGGFIPEHDGQPSARSAWLDAGVDAASGHFYSGTLSTMESGWVRPRFAGFVPVQAQSSQLIRDAIAGRINSADARERIADLFARQGASA